MSKRTTKRKHENDAMNDSSDRNGPSAKKPHMSSANRTKRLSLLDDYGSRPSGRGKSEKPAQYSFFDKQREKKASKSVVAKFQARINWQTGAMRKVVDSEEAKLKKRRKQVAAEIEQLYAIAASTRNSDPDTCQHKTDHILYEEAEHVTQNSRKLVAEFEKADEMLKEFTVDLPLDTWAQDRCDIAEIMMCGRDHGQSIIEELLAPGMHDSRYERILREHAGSSDIAAGLLKKSRKALDEETWGDVFDDQVRRCVALANTVPDEVVAHRKL